VAVLGSENFDVTTIDIASIRLADVAPIRSSFEDVAASLIDGNECECTKEGYDGYTDLTLKFKTQQIVEALGEVVNGEVLILRLTGELYDGTAIDATDCIVVRGKHKPHNKADLNKDGVVDAVDFAMLAENWLQSSNGPHYTLNIIGVAEEHPKNMVNCSGGNRIFVKLGDAPDISNSSRTSRTNILLFKGMDFMVLDCDGTDGEASIMLPDPDPSEGSMSTRYSVHVRTLGGPGGRADINVCATYDDPCTGELLVFCGDTVSLERTKGQTKKATGSQKSVNVSKELLTDCVYVGDDTVGNPIYERQRVYIFDPMLEDEMWNYNNTGLSHTQIQLYYVPTAYSVEEWECP
jgi:hypothetical protein